jgi:hypothetical protein
MALEARSDGTGNRWARASIDPTSRMGSDDAAVVDFAESLGVRPVSMSDRFPCP